MATKQLDKDLEQEDHGKVLAEWQFPEYPKYERSKFWYFWYIVITLAFLSYAIFTANFLFSIIIVMVAFIIYFQNKKEPAMIDFQITEDGLLLNERFYEFSKLKKFRIVYKPPEFKDVFFDFKSSLRPELYVPLEDRNPIQIRNILLEYLEEDTENTDEGFSHGMRRLLKF